jgi:hypothetical protein
MSVQKYSRHLINTEERDSRGRTILLHALGDLLCQRSPEGITTLLGWGADITARDLKGNTCLHVAINRVDFVLESYKARWLDILAILILSGVDVAARNFSNESVFDVACEIFQQNHCYGTMVIDIWLAGLRSCGYSPEDVIGPRVAAHKVQFGERYGPEHYQRIQHWVGMKIYFFLTSQLTMPQEREKSSSSPLNSKSNVLHKISSDGEEDSVGLIDEIAPRRVIRRIRLFHIL